METSHARECSRRFDVVLALLLGCGLAFSFWTYLELPLTRPSAGDYARAAAHVRDNFQAGDVVDVNPFWATRVRELLGDLAMQQLRHVDREDLSRYRRVWLFSLFGAQHRPEIQRCFDGRAALVEERRFGRIDVRLYRLAAPVRILFDFRSELARARVWLERGERRLPCERWVHGRWICPGESWNSVTRAILEIGDEPREVIWDHPLESAVKAIQWDDVPIGRQLVVYSGFRTSAVWPGGAPVTLVVTVDGRDVARWERRNEPGWGRLEIDTSAFAGRRHAVAFRVTTPRQTRRHFAFAAEALE